MSNKCSWCGCGITEDKLSYRLSDSEYLCGDCSTSSTVINVVGGSNALDVQIGGGHYKDMAIQPVEFITKNDLGFCEGNIVKYISRYSRKGGVEDIDKVIHYAELLKQLKYGE